MFLHKQTDYFTHNVFVYGEDLKRSDRLSTPHLKHLQYSGLDIHNTVQLGLEEHLTQSLFNVHDVMLIFLLGRVSTICFSTKHHGGRS